MARKVICKLESCKKKDSSDNMILHIHEVESGRTYNKYYCKGCYQNFIEQQEFLKKEQKEMDQLIEIIKVVHEIDNVPGQFYPFLQDLRNGSSIVMGKKNRRYKEGFAFKVISETYRKYQDDIRYWKNRKNFEGSTLKELRYCLAIVIDKIQMVKKQINQLEQQEAREKTKEIVPEFVEREITYKRNQKDNGILEFLD
ncbi:hypothetical protein [Chengkuizengella marina]|uniref:Uncharacterized protein n=1 Tax=Chengkuizengella marina TaxID=2507566 RepID=A0A6N9Q810_9BACL|nr:hypothetical protein [Chengkuizengella marina]NBI31007.1 hypothetical protein [Chengkuizengella marina]